MRKLLKAVLHKDAYTAAVAILVRDWFREVIFEPLWDRMRDAGLKWDYPADQAIKHDELGRVNGRGTWTLFDPKLGGLSMQRLQLPQVEHDQKQELIFHLRRQGIHVCEGTALPGQLKPCQEGFYAEAVHKARKFAAPKGPLMCSSDLYIIDGHHQWYGCLLERPDKPVPILQFDAPIGVLLAAVETFPRVTHENALGNNDAIVMALESGRIWYEDGAFLGTFGSSISRELRKLGAHLDPHHRRFEISLEDLPLTLRAAINEAKDKMTTLQGELTTTLGHIEAHIAESPTLGIPFTGAVEKIVTDLHKQFVHTVSAVESIEVPMISTAATRKAIAEDFTNNLDLYIRKFSAEMIPELRRRVEANAAAGYRASRLAEIIEAQYGVTKRKAEFLAEQETSLLVSKFREQEYKAIGSDTYKWSTSHDERVRPDHRALDGKVFSWDNPPITCRSTGAHNNPGEDFRCRCVAVAIVNLSA